jgi:imidazolonepropionase-like amidohydrolase
MSAAGIAPIAAPSRENEMMKFYLRTRRAAAALAVLALSSCIGPAEGVSAGEPRTIISDVTVIPMTRPGVLARQDVAVQSGRIVALTRRGSIRRRPSDHVIDGTGKFLMPGLWDMHVHAVKEGEGSVRSTLPLYTAYGIVGVRDMGSRLQDLVAARGAIEAEATRLPAVVAGGPVLDGPPRRYQQRVAMPLADAAAATSAVSELAGAGVDFLKVYDTLTADQYRAILSASRQAGLPVDGHVPLSITVEQASAAGQRSIEHIGIRLASDCIPAEARPVQAMLNAWIQRGDRGRMEEVRRLWALRDQPVCRALFARMGRRGTWVNPALGFEVKGGAWTEAADMADLPAALRASCLGRLATLNAVPAQLREEVYGYWFDQVLELHRAGVPLLAGSDVPNDCQSHGYSLHRELQLLARSGLSSWEVLKTATANPARFLGRVDEGVIRIGAVANLLLLDSNPLADVANTLGVRGVMMRGRWFDQAELQSMRASARAAAEAPPGN